MNATLEPITEETAFLLTEAGMDALRMTPTSESEVSEMAIPAPTEAGDAILAPDAPVDASEAQAQGENEGFTPDTKERADWVLGKIADARSRAARIRENAETMAKQAEAEATFFEWKYGPALQAFARQELEGARRKSLTLYHGTIGFKTKGANVSIGDTKAALAWARENLPEAVIETIDKKAIEGALLSTGEAVPFAALNAAEEVFYIR